MIRDSNKKRADSGSKPRRYSKLAKSRKAGQDYTDASKASGKKQYKCVSSAL